MRKPYGHVIQVCISPKKINARMKHYCHITIEKCTTGRWYDIIIISKIIIKYNYTIYVYNTQVHVQRIYITQKIIRLLRVRIK